MSRLGPSARAQQIAQQLDARDAAIRAAHEAGDGPDAIAKALGMRVAAVIATLRRFGLEPRPLDPIRAGKACRRAARERAPRLPPAKPPAKPTVAGDGRDAARARRCLKCGEDFLSAHAGNRLCEPCKQEIRTVDDGGAYSVGGFEDASRGSGV